MRDVNLRALKFALADIDGIETLTQANVGGRMVFGFGVSAASTTIGVDPAATDDQIIAAIRKAAEAKQPAPAAPAAAAPQPTQGTTTMSVTGAAHVGTSLKDMLNDRKAKIAAAHDKLNTNFGKLDQATAALDTLGDKVGAEADDLLATVGQISNEIVGGS